MITSGAFTGNIDTFYRKTWSIPDQLIAFGTPFVSSPQSTASLIEPIVIPLGLTQDLLKTGHVFVGADITQALLNESIEYFQKALYNFNSQYLLARSGYSTWAGVTNYYSSYFSVYSLLSLQGRVITRIRLDGVKYVTCLLHPIDLRNHIYLLTTKENRDATHKLPWNKYYDIYNSYTCLRPQFDIVQQKVFTSEPIDESEERNRINYKIYEGFQEILDIANIQTFKDQYLNSLSTPELGSSLDEYLLTLRSLATDPIFMYFARAAIRLVLVKEIFDKIGTINEHFKDEVDLRIPNWQRTMFDSYNPAINYFEDFVNVFLA